MPVLSPGSTAMAALQAGRQSAAWPPSLPTDFSSGHLRRRRRCFAAPAAPRTGGPGSSRVGSRNPSRPRPGCGRASRRSAARRRTPPASADPARPAPGEWRPWRSNPRSVARRDALRAARRLATGCLTALCLPLCGAPFVCTPFETSRGPSWGRCGRLRRLPGRRCCPACRAAMDSPVAPPQAGLLSSGFRCRSGPSSDRAPSPAG